jgi:hypothetical protein
MVDRRRKLDELLAGSQFVERAHIGSTDVRLT